MQIVAPVKTLQRISSAFHGVGQSENPHPSTPRVRHPVIMFGYLQWWYALGVFGSQEQSVRHPSRFLSEDPARFGAATDFYAYVANRPVDFVDAFGLCPKNPKECYGEARVIGAGKSGTGAFGAPNLPGTLAIIPTQFTGTAGATPRAYAGAKGKLRPIIGQIGVSIANPLTGEPMVPLGPITDVIGPTSNAAKLMRNFPGELILEINGVPEGAGPKGPMRFLPVMITVPNGLPCPTGTAEVQ